MDAREGTYVARSTTTVDQACREWLASKHGARPTTLAGYRDVLKPVRAAYGALAVQKLTKRHLDELVRQLRAEPSNAWTAKPVDHGRPARST